MSNQGHLRTVLAALAGGVAVTASAMWLVGLHPVIPWVLVQLFATIVPFGYVLAEGAHKFDSINGGGRWRSVGAALFGLLILWVYVPGRPVFLVADLVFYSLLIASMIIGPSRQRRRAGRMALIFLGVSLGYAIVWNGNYLALRAVGERLHDPAVLRLDTWLYANLLPGFQTYDGLFPVIRVGWFVQLLEHAYMSFGELAVVLFLLADDRVGLRRFLLALASAYAAGLIIFMLWPVAGPCLYYPASIQHAVQGPITEGVMRASLLEFNAIRGGGQPITGFAYFVAIPSLHAALAVLMQSALRSRSATAAAVFLPINVLMALSTVLLGYHYIIDTIAGVLLAMLCVWCATRLIAFEPHASTATDAVALAV